MVSRSWCIATLMAATTVAPVRSMAGDDPSPVILDSKIISVTVFSDRAEVTRTATIKLPAGRHVLVFDTLPDGMDAGSIQVNGTGGAVLQDIRQERVQQVAVADEKAAKLEQRLQALNDSMALVESAKARADSERSFVQKIIEGVTSVGGKEVPVVLDPDKWIKMTSFYREKIDMLDDQLAKAERRTREINEQTGLVQRMQADLNGVAGRSTNQVALTVDVPKEGSMMFNLSYLVAGPRWLPLYDVRFSSADKKLKLVYKAQVFQSTGEDWKNVTVKLSTARPQAGGTHPNLEPWGISLYQPAYDDMSDMKMKRASAAPMPQMMNAYELEEKMKPSEEPILAAVATVETRSTSAVFVPQGKSSILCDNQPYTVTIMEKAFPAVLRYSAVPKLAQHAYLKAKATNSTDFPFLPGTTNIYLDNAFVAKGSMELVAPSEEFWTFLGADDAIAVKYQLLRRFEKKEGLAGRKTCVVYEYRMTVTNNRKTEEELVMWDQLPVSNSQDLTVELIEPKYKADTDFLKMNENKYLEWYFKLKPGQEIKVTFSFSVTYPKNRTVYGL
jgi:uncharacterized protein (TIGR02231 family)